jgi:hypothetical protein
MKLYDLMWTPDITDVYKENYVDWREPIREYVLPRTEAIVRKQDTIGRSRLSFVLKNGGTAEVKISDIIDRQKSPCYSCSYKDVCLEDYTDYARVDSSLNFYSCYMRRDLGFNIADMISSRNASAFKKGVEKMMGENTEDFLKDTPLRFTIMPACNFNCRMPGTNKSWCMEMSDEYRYPKIKPSTFKNLD